MGYQEFDFRNEWRGEDARRYRLDEVLRDPNILDPTHTLFFVGPGSRRHSLVQAGKQTLRNVDGPMDGLAFFVGFLGNPLVFVERPEDVIEGGMRATEQAFETLRVLESVGYSPFEVAYFDMNNPNLGELRLCANGSATFLDNRSHMFWGPVRQDTHTDKQAMHVLSQYGLVLRTGDRLLLTFKYGDRDLLEQYADVCDQVGLVWKAIKVEGDFAVPRELARVRLEGGNVSDGKVSTVAASLLVVDKQ